MVSVRKEEEMKNLYVQLEDEQYDKIKDLAIRKSVKIRERVAMVEIIREMIDKYEEEYKNDINK